jgi:hypothetical protein
VAGGWSFRAGPIRRRLSGCGRAGPSEEVLTLNYQPAYRVLALVAPAEGATVRFEPPSPDGFYAAGSALRLVAEPRPGFRFKLWDGDVPGATPELSLAVSEPRIVRAVLETHPVRSAQRRAQCRRGDARAGRGPGIAHRHLRRAPGAAL